MFEDVIDTAELREDYRRHLEEATEVVNSWPSWKQSVLERAVSVSDTESSSDLKTVKCNSNNQTDSK